MKKLAMVPIPIVLCSLAAASCGSGALVIPAKYPTEPQSLEPDSGLTVLVKGAGDARAFEASQEWPESISSPLYFGTRPTDEDLARIVGARYGKEVTNIHLPESQSVGSIVEDLLDVAFRQAGYRIAEEGDEADLVVEASIQQFWLWMTPGGMTIRIEASIQAQVTVTAKDGTVTFLASGHHDYTDASTSPDSYRFALDEALFDFYTDVSTRCLDLSFKAAPAEQQ